MHCSRAGSLRIEIAHLFSVPISVSYAVTGDDFHTASMGASGKGVAATHGRTVVDTRVVPEGNTVDADSLTWVTMGDGITESSTFSVGSNHPHRLRLRERTSSPHAAPMPARGRCPHPIPHPAAIDAVNPAPDGGREYFSLASQPSRNPLGRVLRSRRCRLCRTACREGGGWTTYPAQMTFCKHFLLRLCPARSTNTIHSEVLESGACL